LSGELFNLMAHVKLVHIPYKGSPQAMTDLLGGRVMAMFSPASTALPHIKAGTLRALAASSARRTSVAPDLPTVAESGLPGFETSVWFGLLAPAATPRDIIERLNKEVARAIGDGEVKKQFATQGIDAMAARPNTSRPIYAKKRQNGRASYRCPAQGWTEHKQPSKGKRYGNRRQGSDRHRCGHRHRQGHCTRSVERRL
jgi:tripartite-type tricarboxylate transporter receptor subunit TctC